MKNKYEVPQLNIVMFSTDDIITTSNDILVTIVDDFWGEGNT